MDVYEWLSAKFLEDEYIFEHTLDPTWQQHQITAHDAPETFNKSVPYIVIDPLDVPTPADYADNKWLSDEYLLQIEVWTTTKDEKICKEIAKRIRKIMWQLNFSQGGGIDEYDMAAKIARDARRYRGKIYIEELGALN